MRIVSFGHTTAALLAGQKTVTRRDWKPQHAARFHKGDLCAAYNMSPRNGGKQVAVIRIARAPYLEPSRDIPDEDWQAEGFQYLTDAEVRVFGMWPADVWTDWHVNPRDLWVVRFEIVEVQE